MTTLWYQSHDVEKPCSSSYVIVRRLAHSYC